MEKIIVPELKKIPDVKFPKTDTTDFNNLNSNEPLVNIREAGLLIDSRYYKDKISGALEDQYARETVVNMLLCANKKIKSLDLGLELIIWDAWRPIEVQQSLFINMCMMIARENPNMPLAEVREAARTYVSKPTKDAPHHTGGAVDLTIIHKESGTLLDMGTEFDDSTDKASVSYFEKEGEDTEIRNNRRLLYNTMIDVGFTSLPSEWWHYDFGDHFYAYFKKTDMTYRGISLGDSE